MREVSKNRIELFDYVRGLAIIHIIFYHYLLENFHGSFLILPQGVLANFERLWVFKDGGILGILKNFFAFLFVYGFTSVNLFLILSGFVLALSMLKIAQRQERHSWWEFLRKRLKRILVPFYISVLFGVGFLFLRNFLFPDLGAWPVYGWVDVLKIILVPFLFFDFFLLQKFNGDYWFIPLILQLYLLFPVLFWLCKKAGLGRDGRSGFVSAIKFLLLIFLLTAGYRFLAAYYFDSVPMGVIYPAKNSYYLFSFFLPRLFEFVLGIVFAFIYNKNNQFLYKMIGVLPFLAALIVTLSGFALDAYKWGWIFSDMVIGVGLFFVFINLGNFLAKINIVRKFLNFNSTISYEIYLLHHYFLNYLLIPFLFLVGLKNETGFWLFLSVFFAGSILLGWIAKRISGKLC